MTVPEQLKHVSERGDAIFSSKVIPFLVVTVIVPSLEPVIRRGLSLPIDVVTLLHMPMVRGRPRVQVAPCKFCHKQFKRLEHLQRHERIRKSPGPLLAVPHFSPS